MYADIVALVLAFIEGFLLILSPCILPILPIILSGSLAGSKMRPFGIIIGFIVTFVLLTLFSRTILQFTHAGNLLRNISLVLLLIVGSVMTSTYLTEKFTLWTQRLTRVGSENQFINNPQGGFLSGILFGSLVGIIWTPCAGPIFAAVIIQVVLQHTSLQSVLVIIAFSIGAGVPMLFIALLGRQFLYSINFFRTHLLLCRKVLGLILIFSVIFLVYYAETPLPSSKANPITNSGSTLLNGLEKPYAAPEIAGIDSWINSAPLTINQLKGKVILIDFWTYSCINCIRTLPYLKDWYAKYHDSGLQIIGVHSPEFAFEHDFNNVKNAVISDGITYPVALDNQFVTWQNYHNEYWPAHYLIDKAGWVVYEHFGEGEYDITENNIRYLLGIQGHMLVPEKGERYSALQTGETYLGFARANRYVSPEGISQNQPALYSYPLSIPMHSWALQGKWIVYADKITAANKGASIKLHFTAGKVFAVMGIAKRPINVQALLQDQEGMHKSVRVNSIKVTRNQLYTIATFSDENDAEIELIASEPGLEIYTFTFGNSMK